MIEIWGNTFVVSPGGHHVSHRRGRLVCSCGIACQAIERVVKYVNEGGVAPNCPYPTEGPSLCPICGQSTEPWIEDRTLARWRCPAGYAHYFMWRAYHLHDPAMELSRVYAASPRVNGIVTSLGSDVV